MSAQIDAALAYALGLIDTGGRMSGHGLQPVELRAAAVIGGAGFIVGAALLALVLPVYASGSDSTVSCGTLVFRHRFPLTEEFCVEEGSYQTRRRVVLAMTGLGIGGVLVGAWRSRHLLDEDSPQVRRVTVGLLVAANLTVVMLAARPDRTVQPQPPSSPSRTVPPPPSAPAG